VRKLADEGAMLAPAAVATVDFGGIVDLVDLDALEVEAEVSEDRLAEIHPQQPALITLDGFPEQFFPGVTGTVRPAVEKSKATAVVKVEFEHVPAGALPDMGAKVAFLSRALEPSELERKPRSSVPKDAVVERDGQQVVFEIEGDRVRAVPVTVSERSGTELVLGAGPPPGTKLAIARGTTLHDRQRVRVEAPS
jgi:multidrug efflux pump subunit AcrA (membrane-fusion protein)